MTLGWNSEVCRSLLLAQCKKWYFNIVLRVNIVENLDSVGGHQKFQMLWIVQKYLKIFVGIFRENRKFQYFINLSFSLLVLVLSTILPNEFWQLLLPPFRINWEYWLLLPVKWPRQRPELWSTHSFLVETYYLCKIFCLVGRKTFHMSLDLVWTEIKKFITLGILIL